LACIGHPHRWDSVSAWAYGNRLNRLQECWIQNTLMMYNKSGRNQ
jgi:hypothetical protein